MQAVRARRSGLAAVLHSPYLSWAILALPAAIQTYRYAGGGVFYGEYLHWTGVLAVQLLILVLALTPLRLVFPKASWLRWLMQRRRYLGVAVFGYAVLHTGAYLLRAQDIWTIIDDAASLSIGTGWVALLVFLVLAGTSNDASVRRLGRRWKRLHLTVFLATVLTFAHWLLTAFDRTAGLVHLAVLIVFLLLRLAYRRT